MPNLTGVSARPFFRYPAARIEGRAVLAPAAVAARPFQLRNQRGDDVVGDLLAVRRHVAPAAIEVRLAHIQRIEVQPYRDRVHHALGEQHALRTAEAAKRRVRNRIGPQPARKDAGCRIEIAIVRMEHGAVVHAERQIGGIAAAAEQRYIDGGERARGVEARLVVDMEIMALAGHDHVVVAVEPDLGRFARDMGGKRGKRRPLRRLGFLAAKAAAHAAAFAHHRGIGDSQHFGHAMLDLARVLGRGIDQHAAAFLRHGHGNLSLEIEMLLPADIDAARETMGRTVKCAWQSPRTN